MRFLKVILFTVVITLLFSSIAAAEPIEKNIIPDCFNETLEKAKIEEMFPEGMIELTLGKTKKITFDDGSYVTYTLIEEPIIYNNKNSQNVSLASTTKTRSVKKQYFFGLADVQIFLRANITWGVPTSRSVTINRAWESHWASFGRLQTDGKADIIRKVGTQNTYAVAETSGSFSLYLPKVGDYHSRSYRFQMLVDPADSSKVYLKDIN